MLTVFFAASTFADESWTSNVGTITYEKDVGNTAVFSYTKPGFQTDTLLFIDGLVPDIMGNRGSYTGQWVDIVKIKSAKQQIPAE